LGAPILDVTAAGSGAVGDIISGGVAVAAGFPPKVITKTGSSALAEIWIEWLEPFAFSAFQGIVIDAPVLMGSKFWMLGMAWFWDNLKDEVVDFSDWVYEPNTWYEEDGEHVDIDMIHDDHQTLDVPSEGISTNPDSDLNNAGGITLNNDDDGFNFDSGNTCVGPDCLFDGSEEGL